MAFDDIKNVRLSICDPVGYNDFVQVADETELPIENIPPQTAYSIQSLKVYKAYSVEMESWQIVNTELSDSRITFFIDAYGVDKARWHSLKGILTSLARQISLAKLKSGSDELTFIKLTDLYAFYKSLLDDVMDIINPPIDAGMWMNTGSPVIGGGM